MHSATLTQTPGNGTLLGRQRQQPSFQLSWQILAHCDCGTELLPLLLPLLLLPPPNKALEEGSYSSWISAVTLTLTLILLCQPLFHLHTFDPYFTGYHHGGLAYRRSLTTAAAAAAMTELLCDTGAKSPSLPLSTLTFEATPIARLIDCQLAVVVMLVTCLKRRHLVSDTHFRCLENYAKLSLTFN